MLVMPPPPPSIAEPLRAVLGLRICNLHRAQMSLADVLGDEGWKMLRAQIAAVGRILPRRQDVTLEFTTVDSPEVRMLEQSRLARRMAVQ